MAGLVRCSDLDREALVSLMDATEHGWGVQRRPSRPCRASVCSIVDDTTAALFETAVSKAGVSPMVIDSEDLPLAPGSSAAAGRVLSAWADLLVIGGRHHDAIEALARASKAPVLNAGSDRHAPVEALAHLAAVRARFGSLEGMKIALLGPPTPLLQSVLESAVAVGADVAVACPPGLEPDAEVVVRATSVAAGQGRWVLVTRDVELAVGGANVIVTDRWVPPTSHRGEGSMWLGALMPYRLDERLLHLAQPDAVVLHPLQGDSVREVSPEVAGGPASLAIEADRLRLPAALAAVSALLN